MIIKDAFNSHYIEYESKEDKDKILSIKELLDMIRPYLSNIINNHKTQDIILSKDICKDMIFTKISRRPRRINERKLICF